MKLLLVVLAMTAIAGCAASAESVTKWKKTGLNINCSGLTSSWEKCYSTAEHWCSANGYKVVARSDQGRNQPEDSLFGFNPAGYTSRSLIVICK